MAVNKVILLGNIGSDTSEVRQAGATNVLELSVATTEKVKKADNWEDLTQWHKVTLWGRLADVVSGYCKKGDRIYIEGKLRYEQYEKDGVTRYVTKIQAERIELLGSRNQQGDTPTPQHANPLRNAQHPQPTPAQYGGEQVDLPF